MSGYAVVSHFEFDISKRIYIPIREHKPIAVEPLRVLRVGSEEADLGVRNSRDLQCTDNIPSEQNVSRRRQTHRSTWRQKLFDSHPKVTPDYHIRYAPGWPELALPTISAARARMVAMAIASEGSGANWDMAEEEWKFGEGSSRWGGRTVPAI